MHLVPETAPTELLDMDSTREEAANKEFLIGCLCVGIVPRKQDTPIWQAVHTLVSISNVPLQRVGFLPVLPRPITDEATHPV